MAGFLDAGDGTFAPDGRYCITLRRRGTILALPPRLDTEGEPLLPDGAVPFLGVIAELHRLNGQAVLLLK